MDDRLNTLRAIASRLLLVGALAVAPAGATPSPIAASPQQPAGAERVPGANHAVEGAAIAQRAVFSAARKAKPRAHPCRPRGAKAITGADGRRSGPYRGATVLMTKRQYDPDDEDKVEYYACLRSHKRSYLVRRFDGLANYYMVAWAVRPPFVVWVFGWSESESDSKWLAAMDMRDGRKKYLDSRSGLGSYIIDAAWISDCGAVTYKVNGSEKHTATAFCS